MWHGWANPRKDPGRKPGFRRSVATESLHPPASKSPDGVVNTRHTSSHAGCPRWRVSQQCFLPLSLHDVNRAREKKSKAAIRPSVRPSVLLSRMASDIGRRRGFTLRAGGKCLSLTRRPITRRTRLTKEASCHCIHELRSTWTFACILDATHCSLPAERPREHCFYCFNLRDSPFEGALGGDAKSSLASPRRGTQHVAIALPEIMPLGMIGCG